MVTVLPAVLPPGARIDLLGEVEEVSPDSISIGGVSSPVYRVRLASGLEVLFPPDAAIDLA